MFRKLSLVWNTVTQQGKLDRIFQCWSAGASLNHHLSTGKCIFIYLLPDENWISSQMNGNEIDWHIWCVDFSAPRHLWSRVDTLPTVTAKPALTPTPPPVPESCTIMQSAIAVSFFCMSQSIGERDCN